MCLEQAGNLLSRRTPNDHSRPAETRSEGQPAVRASGRCEIACRSMTPSRSSTTVRRSMCAITSKISMPKRVSTAADPAIRPAARQES